MADNQAYLLRRRIDAAYVAAEKSCLRADFDYFHSLNAIAEAEKHRLTVDAYIERHGSVLGAVEDLPPWSKVTHGA